MKTSQLLLVFLASCSVYTICSYAQTYTAIDNSDAVVTETVNRTINVDAETADIDKKTKDISDWQNQKAQYDAQYDKLIADAQVIINNEQADIAGAAPVIQASYPVSVGTIQPVKPPPCTGSTGACSQPTDCCSGVCQADSTCQ